MRIRSLETFAVGLPFKRRYTTASGSLERREMIVVRLTDEAGNTGHGDGVPMSLRGGPGLQRVRSDLERRCRRALLASSLDVDASPAEADAAIRSLVRTCRSAGTTPGALAAVDAALLDLVGRRRALPAWALLGATSAEAVACNGTLDAGEPEEVASAAGALAERGFRTLKVKVGAGDDAERLRAVRAACGANVALRVDANGAWDVREARLRLGALEDAVGLELAEQPCAGLDELAELRRQIAVPIVADESVAGAHEADRAMALGACDAATLKLAKVGGAHAALDLAARIPAYLSSALDSGLGIAAAVHVAQAMAPRGFAAGLAHGLATSPLLAADVASLDGFGGPTIAPPAGPGLGIEVDDDALRSLQIA